MSEDLSIGLTLIGAGRVGMSLLRHCVSKGIEVCAVVEPSLDRHASIRSVAPSARVLTSLPPALPRSTDVCILAVPDDQIARVASSLADRPMLHSGALVFHVSGMRGAEDMLPLQEAGCHAGCLHPMQSFPEQPLAAERMCGIGCGIEGSDNFWVRARDFAVLLDWMPLRIDARRKALYHAACVFAGNFTTVVAGNAERLLRHATQKDESLMDYLLPMMESVMAQLHDHPPEQVLTGPAARADTLTIGAHTQALDEHFPDILKNYMQLTAAAAHLSLLSEEDKKALRKYLGDSI